MLVRTIDSPLGNIVLAARAEHLVGLWFFDQKNCSLREQPQSEDPLLRAAERWVQAYFAGEHPAHDMLPLAPQGTMFQRAVWRILVTIPYGSWKTYGEIAAIVAPKKGSLLARAVGSAVAKNPISLLIPCHRVLGKNGALTGYAGGLARKEALLRLEGISTSA